MHTASLRACYPGSPSASSPGIQTSPLKPNTPATAQIRPLPGTLFALLTLLASTLPSLAAAASDPSQGFQWRPFLAPFHSVLLHFPIGFVTLAFLLDLYYLRHRTPEIRRLTSLLMSLCLASALVVASLGITRASGGGYEANALSSHRLFGILVTSLILLTFITQKIAYRHEHSRPLQLGYRFVLASSLMALVITGHLGGSLTYGSDYLVKNAPPFVKTMFDHDPKPDPPSPLTDPSTDPSTAGRSLPLQIQAVFESKCFKCHGSNKQKGHYRLDLPDIALKGGDSELPAIQPGQPLQSNLIRLILLPEDDDDVMPPHGKERLTPEEILALIHWIHSGAPFPTEPPPEEDLEPVPSGS